MGAVFVSRGLPATASMPLSTGRAASSPSISTGVYSSRSFTKVWFANPPEPKLRRVAERPNQLSKDPVYYCWVAVALLFPAPLKAYEHAAFLGIIGAQAKVFTDANIRVRISGPDLARKNLRRFRVA